eukprot:gene4290-5009_t
MATLPTLIDFPTVPLGDRDGVYKNPTTTYSETMIFDKLKSYCDRLLFKELKDKLDTALSGYWRSLPNGQRAPSAPNPIYSEEIIDLPIQFSDWFNETCSSCSSGKHAT